MFQIRLKELRELNKLSQKKLSQKMNVAQSTVAMWENGKNKPEFQTLLKLSELFNVSVDYLTGSAELSSNYDTNPKKGIKIPVLGRVAAGIPIEAIEDVLDFEEITPEMASKGEHFALQIKGDSMEPRIKDGDVVIVRRQSDVDSGQIAIVLVNGDDATCKKYVKHDNGISLISMNPAYSPMFYTCEEVEKKPIVILGRVIELRAKF